FCLVIKGGQLALPSKEMLQWLPAPTGESIAIVAGWLTFQALLQLAGPGRLVEGPRLRDGTRLLYRMNGWFAWCVTLAALAAGAGRQFFPPAVLAEKAGALLATANIAAFLIGIALYAGRGLLGARDERVSDSVVCNFWLGAALNPRIGSFDLKLFFESRPGLMAWVALDVAFACRQHELYGFVSAPMMLVCGFHFWYVVDYFWHEEAILTTWDVKHENFGWMLCWGDLVWVPFIYTVQAYYLIDHAHSLSASAMAALIVLNVIGYVVFRGANIQKHRFRNDPRRPIWGRPPRIIDVQGGSALLASGWWGLSRHMNYLGDLLMALSWSLCCGFGSPLPYFHPAYLAVLLIHRERRDHRMCAAQYGEAWKAYCATVRYRIVPGLY